MIWKNTSWMIAFIFATSRWTSGRNWKLVPVTLPISATRIQPHSS